MFMVQTAVGVPDLLFSALHRADFALLGCCAACSGLYWDRHAGFPCASSELHDHNQPMGPPPGHVSEPGTRADQA